jgi:hypothetical protein
VRRGLASAWLSACLLVATPALAEDAKTAPKPDPEAATDASETAEKAAPNEKAAAPPAGGAGDSPSKKSDVELSARGYVQAGLGFRYRENAIPRDQVELAFTGQAGVVLQATVLEDFRSTVHVLLNSRALEALTGVEAVDFDGNGSLDAVVSRSRRFPAVFLEEASLSYAPDPLFSARAGVMLIPFTTQLQSPSFALMFPNRATPNEVFVSGSDLGLNLATNVDDRFTASIGAFLGDSLGLTLEGLTPRGVVLQARADVQPFGAFSVGEGDPLEGPFRLGVGGGLLVRPAELFDRTGLGGTSMLDVRASGSIRMSYEGLYLGLEYLFRRQTDAISSRPLVAQGAYSQLSWFLRASERIAFEPIARLGFVVLDQSFDARTTGFVEGGLSLYPAAHGKRADRVRVTAQYLGERRFSEGEDAHGGLLSGRILF